MRIYFFITVLLIWHSVQSQSAPSQIKLKSATIEFDSLNVSYEIKNNSDIALVYYVPVLEDSKYSILTLGLSRVKDKTGCTFWTGEIGGDIEAFEFDSTSYVIVKPGQGVEFRLVAPLKSFRCTIVSGEEYEVLLRISFQPAFMKCLDCLIPILKDTMVDRMSVKGLSKNVMTN